MDGGIKNGAKYIKSLKGFDPVMVRVLSDFILKNYGKISDKAILKILKAVKKKGLSPIDFISIATSDRMRLIRETTTKRLGVFESSSELNKLLKEINEITPIHGSVRIGMDPVETGERFWYSPEFIQMKLGLVTVEAPGRYLVLIYLSHFKVISYLKLREMKTVD